MKLMSVFWCAAVFAWLLFLVLTHQPAWQTALTAGWSVPLAVWVAWQWHRG